jgi:hypothetical protein
MCYTPANCGSFPRLTIFHHSRAAQTTGISSFFAFGLAAVATGFFFLFSLFSKESKGHRLGKINNKTAFEM